MTTYAPNFTPRLRVKYVPARLQHTIQVRGPRGTSFALMSNRCAVIHDVFNLWAPKLANDFAFISAEVALTDSEIWYPTDPPAAVTGSLAPSTFSPTQKITSTSFAGKAADSRARLSLFGIRWVQGNPLDEAPSTFDGSYNGVITPAENALVSNTVTAITTQFFAVSGEATRWYPRATIKINDHLLKLVRRGTVS